MKTTNLFHLILILSLLFSCKKNENSSISPINAFSLKKDGILYVPKTVNAFKVSEDVIYIETYHQSNQVANNTYGITIRSTIQPGTYQLEDGESEYFSIIHIQDENNMFGWEDGTLTVVTNNTVDKILVCKFDVTLYNDEIDQYPEITDGKFLIHY